MGGGNADASAEHAGTEDLGVHALGRDAQRDQRVTLRGHECDRAADVIVGIRHQRVLLDACRREAPFEIVIDARTVVRADQLVHHRALHVRVRARRVVEPVAERVHRARPAGVDEAHFALAAFGDERRRHRHHRRDADAAGDQHDRRVDVALERELAHRRGDFDDRAFLDAVMHQRRHLAGRNRLGLARLALHGDAQPLAVRRVRQAVLAGLIDTQLAHEALDRRILARLEHRRRAAIGRRQVERRDLVALAHLARHLERTEAAPCRTRIQVCLGADQDLRELAVRDAPCFERVGIDRVAEHFDDRCEQVLADDRVMLRTDVQAGMLVRDVRHRAAQHAQIVDVRRIGVDGARQGFGLVAGRLVGLVEQVLQLGMPAEHALVEMLRDRRAVLGKNRGGGLHTGHLVGGELGHVCSPLNMHVRYIFNPGHHPRQIVAGH
ncbi:protein of unknown function [Burkholderia multivorans]